MDQGDFGKSRYICKYIFPALHQECYKQSSSKGRVPITTILKTGGWRSMKTFERFYDKEIVERKDDFALNILDNVKL